MHAVCSLHIPLLANTARTRFSGAAQAARGGDGPAAARASAPLLSGRGGRVPRRVPVPDQPALPHSPGAAHDHLAAARAARIRPAAVVRASAQTGAPALRSSARGPRVPAACTLPVPEARGTLYVRTTRAVQCIRNLAPCGAPQVRAAGRGQPRVRGAAVQEGRGHAHARVRRRAATAARYPRAHAAVRALPRRRHRHRLG